MSAIFHHAMRYEWVDRNPIKLVRQSAKREKVPEILELSELQLLLSKLFVRERTLALLDAATGLRVSELLALRWSNVDFENLELRVTRSIWHQVVGNCKTEASAKPVPMDSYMAEDIDVRMWVACNPITPELVLAKLAEDPIALVRRGVAQNRSTPMPPLIRLNDDADVGVRILVFRNRNRRSHRRDSSHEHLVPGPASPQYSG